MAHITRTMAEGIKITTIKYNATIHKSGRVRTTRAIVLKLVGHAVVVKVLFTGFLLRGVSS